MDSVCHYTSGLCWLAMQVTRNVFPMTEYFTKGTNKNGIIEPRTHEIVKPHKYIVATESPDDKRWEEFGLWKDLYDRVSGYIPGFERLVPLKLSVEGQEGAFVREHKFVSPKWFKETHGKDLWTMYMRPLRANGEKPTDGDQKVWMEAMGLHYNTVVPLEEYEGQFEVPEFWLPNKVPLSLVERVRIT